MLASTQQSAAQDFGRDVDLVGRLKIAFFEKNENSNGFYFSDVNRKKRKSCSGPPTSRIQRVSESAKLLSAVLLPTHVQKEDHSVIVTQS